MTDLRKGPRTPPAVARTLRKIVFRGPLAMFAWAFAAFNVLVFVWLFASSFKDTREIFDSPWSAPVDWLWSNYHEAWVAASFGSGAINSALLVSCATIAVMVIAAPAAYALSRFNVRGSRSITMLFALGLGVPGPAIFIPVYVMLNEVGLVNSLFGLFFVYIGINLPFAVFFLTGFFRGLPPDVEEAAAIDGAGVFRTYWQIMLPLAGSGVLTCGLLTFIALWAETLFAIVILQDKVTLPLSLLNFSQTMQYNGAQWAILFAGCVTVMLPILVIYIWFGRRILGQFSFSDK